jgi:hypothetical protein
VKQPESGRERPVGDIVLDGTPQVTALADAKAQDNHGYAAVLHRGLQTRAGETQPEVPAMAWRARTANQPESTGLELAELQEA